MVVHKTHFSGFQGQDLEQSLRAAGCDTVILAGVHLHACVRATALDAYQKGWRVLIATDAMASDDPAHGAATQRYLELRAARFLAVEEILDELMDGRAAGGATGRATRQIVPDSDVHVAGAIRNAAEAQRSWARTAIKDRAALLVRLADKLLQHAGPIAVLMAREIGKPVTMAEGEVRRAAELLSVTAGLAGEPLTEATSAGALARRVPVGVVAAITPWNNPVAVPVGKLAPALLYGNAVVWKPAPVATMLAETIVELLREAGCPAGLVGIVRGGERAATGLADDARIDGVTLTGSEAAGYALGEICLGRHKPYQAELGGNNAAIVWKDADLQAATGLIAMGAFGFAGQRCTANRRVIVGREMVEEFLGHLLAATRALRWGDPLDPAVSVGPLVSAGRRDAVASLIARTSAKRILVPHRDQPDHDELRARGAYLPPTVVCDPEPDSEIVQEESFGPVLVVQTAGSFDEAMRLCNGVRQGLVAALFSPEPTLQERFLAEARAGILKINRSTVDADAVSPFGGWKASGMGPPEHGKADREFFTRVQTVYGASSGAMP
jgi:acyl-CoA reductase-like NAD-dependent aldehyde dehydrogenase